MDKATQYCSPEVWGGIECTINRIDNTYNDQLHLSGHYYREGDIAHLASLNVRKLRYPILWEKHQPEKNGPVDWKWAQKQLDELRKFNVEVIAGLVHHGSGPIYTDLLDPNFCSLLAAYAGQVAAQFPWIEYYTPVNEPLTTARFSGLYGIWYPHKKDPKSFVQMLLNQLKATVLAMQEIRKVNPRAKLVQTEDLGKTYSTPELAYQAEFENERRWLTYDILCGRFNREHPLWSYFSHIGIDMDQLVFFQENICQPDIFGFNHYLTSERYLDHRLQLYPAHTHGGNSQQPYADVEAVRVDLEEQTGIEILLKEAWQRFQQPIAITEVHLHCHREEQMRWFKHVWNVACKVKKEGIDLRAVTTWSMLGSYGWNKLLTQPGGDYEPGAFDLRGGYLRPTALAKYIREIAGSKKTEHPLSDHKGWWQRESRLLYHSANRTLQMSSHQSAPVLIIGKNGTLGRAFARVCDERYINFRLLSRQDCDISHLPSIEAAINDYKPWAIINTAGYVRVDDAENDVEACMRDNTYGPLNLAIACKRHGIALVSFSSDLVFDGDKPIPYVESDLPNPLNVYGRSKAQSEILVQKEFPSALMIRTSAFFGPWDEFNFIHHVCRQLSQFEKLNVSKDLHVSPTYVPHLTNATLDLLIDGESGIWHLANRGSYTWSELAYMTADRFGLDHSLINPVNTNQLNYPAKRPFYSVLGTERGQLLPGFEEAFNEYCNSKNTLKLQVA